MPRADGADEMLGTVRQRAVLPESVPSLGTAFKQDGYRLGYVGPWHMGGDEAPRHGWTDYWRTYRYWPDGRDYYVQHLESVGLADAFHEEHRRYGFSKVGVTGVAPSGPSELPVEHSRTSWTIDRAIEFIDSSDERPWLFCASIKDPHPPVVVPGGFADLIDPAEVELPASLSTDLATMPDALARSNDYRWTRNMTEADWRRLIAHYQGLVAHVDTEVGRLLDALDASGAAADTIVVFTSDHGEMMGAHHMLAKGPCMFEESIAIPLVVRWPGRIEAGRQTDDLFSTIDFAATVGNLCGVPVDPGEGVDFAPLLLDRASGPRSEVFSEFYVTAEARDDLMFVKTDPDRPLEAQSLAVRAVQNSTISSRIRWSWTTSSTPLSTLRSAPSWRSGCASGLAARTIRSHRSSSVPRCA